MITAVVSYEPEDYVRAGKTMRGRRPLYGYLVVWAGVAFFVVLQNLRTSGIVDWLVVFLAVLFCGVMVPASVAAFREIERIRIKRQLNSSKLAEGSYTYVFDEQGFSIGGELAQSELKWAAIIKAVETEKDFYFYTSKKFAQIVPKRAFASQSDIDQVRQLTGSALGERARVLSLTA